MNKTRIYLVPLLLMCLVASLFPADPKPQSEADAKRKILTLSLCFPGLGQLKEKQYLKAAIFMTGELFCIVQILIANSKGNDSYWNYRFATSQDEVVRYRQQTEEYDRQRNAYIFVAAGIWILNMIDIFFHAKKKYPPKPAVNVQPIIDHEKNKAYLHIGFSF